MTPRFYQGCRPQKQDFWSLEVAGSELCKRWGSISNPDKFTTQTWKLCSPGPWPTHNPLPACSALMVLKSSVLVHFSEEERCDKLEWYNACLSETVWWVLGHLWELPIHKGSTSRKELPSNMKNEPKKLKLYTLLSLADHYCIWIVNCVGLMNYKVSFNWAAHATQPPNTMHSLHNSPMLTE